MSDSSLPLEDLVARWRGPLTGLLRSRGCDVRQAQELAQDVLAEAWLSKDRYRGAWDDRGLGAWLAGIARNLHRNAQRERVRTPRSLEPSDSAATPVAAEVVEEEGLDAIREAVDRLPESEREVVRIYYLEECTTAQVGALLGLSERAVEGRLRRAREKLRVLLDEATAKQEADY